MSQKLDYALAHLALGFRVFPLGETSKAPRISKKDGGNGCHDATEDEASVRAWWQQYPNANIGVAVGDGLVLIDEDTYKGADLSEWNLPPTLTVKTAHGGLHHYYRYAGPPLPCVTEGVLAPHVCIKAEGGYGVGPGSVVDGKRYEWIDKRHPIADLPERVAELIRTAAARPEAEPRPRSEHNGHASEGDAGMYWLTKAMARTGDGVGDSMGHWLAMQLLIEEKHGASVDVRGVLIDYARLATMNPAKPFTERDVDRWITSAGRSRIVANGERARSQQSGSTHREERSQAGEGDTSLSSHPKPPDMMSPSTYQGIAGDDDTDDGPTLPAEAAPFPVAAFPEPLRDLLTEGAKAFPCPPDLIGVPLLALLGAAIGNSRHLQIKRTWREAPILWAAPIADPGGKKTPVLKLLRSWWDKRQREFMKQYEQELGEWEQAEQQGREPVVRQAYVSDVTMEALADALIVNERGIALIRDELDGWVRSMNQYKEGKGSDRQNWLSLWSGESFPLNRRNRRKPVFVGDPFVCITGGIQPDILPDLNDERGRQDGFIHRILFAYPDKMPITGFTEDEVSGKTLDALGTIFARLWNLKPEVEEDGTARPALLGFTPAGKRVWQEWNDEHAREQNDPTFPAVLSGPWQKFVSYAARIALILHLTRWAADEKVSHDVDETSMGAAADLIDYFKAHARRVYTLLHTSEDDRRVLATVEWIRRQPERKTTARAILRAHVGGVKNAGEAKSLLGKLADYGYGTLSAVASARGLPSLTFTLTAKASPRNSENHATGDNKARDQAGRAA